MTYKKKKKCFIFVRLEHFPVTTVLKRQFEKSEKIPDSPAAPVVPEKPRYGVLNTFFFFFFLLVMQLCLLLVGNGGGPLFYVALERRPSAVAHVKRMGIPKRPAESGQRGQVSFAV